MKTFVPLFVRSFIHAANNKTTANPARSDEYLQIKNLACLNEICSYDKRNVQAPDVGLEAMTLRLKV